MTEQEKKLLEAAKDIAGEYVLHEYGGQDGVTAKLTMDALNAAPEATRYLANEMSHVFDPDAWTKEQILKNVQDRDHGDEMRKNLDEKLAAIQTKFDERHPNPESPHTQELQKKLDEQFEAVRAQLEVKLAAERQKWLEQEKDRSR